MANPPPSLNLAGWPAGIDNRSAEFALRQGAARNLVNVNVRASGKIVRRQGYAKVLTEANPHSLFSNGSVVLYVANGRLKQLVGAVSTTLDPGLGDAPTVYADKAGEVFFSNGLKTGRWANGYRTWGVDNPPQQPQADALPTGGLFAGTYQVAITWRDALGIESGTPLTATVDVSEGGGILLSDFPPPPGYVESVGVYVSSHNGTELYLDNDYPAWTTSVVIERDERSIPLETEYQQPMPPVQRVCVQSGRVYGAAGQALYVTNPFNPYLTSLDGVLFESPITALMPVTDGVYVVTERKAYFMQFEADVPMRRELAYHGAVPGAVAFDPINPGVLWLGEKGLMRGLPGGENQNLTEQVAMPKAQQGSMTIREEDGERFAIVSMWGCMPNPLVSSEWAQRETTRKGNPF